MERLRQWFIPTEEQALQALTPSTAVTYWLTSDPKQREELFREAPYLISGSWILSIFSHVRSLIWSDELVQKGHDNYPDGMFKMPFFGQWATVVTGKYVGEIVRAPDTHLSFQQVLNDQLQIEHLAGTEISEGQIHIALLRTLNRNLDGLYTEILDESEAALADALNKGKLEDGWTSVRGFGFVYNIIHQLNQRAFVGIPLCHDAEWAKAQKKESTSLLMRGYLLKAFPKSRRGDANEYISRFGAPSSIAADTLMSALKERQDMSEEERPNDLLTWMLPREPGEEPNSKLAFGILALVSLGAQNTTSTSFGHTIFHLAASPEHTSTLLEEIKEAIGDGNLTYESLGRMRKLDSFIRETQRLSGISNVTLSRMALQDFSFSNGVCVRAGEMVLATATPVHHDASHYPEPLEFKPWRFYELAQAEIKDPSIGRLTAKYDMVTPSKTYLTWGLGRHACPGRWYAAMIMKHLLAYLILHYEMKLPDSAKGKRPPNVVISGSCIPNPYAHLLLRRKLENAE